VSCPENETLRATVTGFSSNNEFAFATTNDPDYDTLTFSLSSDVWMGSGPPQKGEVVVIQGVSRFTQGWRALKARRFTPDDEHLVGS